MNLNLKNDGFERAGTIVVPEHLSKRLKTGNENLDAIFGGGIAASSNTIIHAGAGVGKTSLCLDLCQKLIDAGYRVKYSSGEENKGQLSATANRIGASGVELGNVTHVEELVKLSHENDLLIVDSFQTLTSTNPKITKHKMIDYCLKTLVSTTKENGCALIFIFQETTDGKIKSGSAMEFALDTHINIERVEGDDELRDIHVIKNRCGRTGIFGARLTSSGYTYTGFRKTIQKPTKKKNNILADIGIEVGAVIVEQLGGRKGNKIGTLLRRFKRYV